MKQECQIPRDKSRDVMTHVPALYDSTGKVKRQDLELGGKFDNAFTNLKGITVRQENKGLNLK